MKVLFLIHSLAMGGAERVTANLANYWAEKGWQVMVATLSAVENDFYELHPVIDRIHLGVAKNSGWMISAIGNNLRSIMAVRRLLKSSQPNVAIGMMTTSSVLLAFAGWRLPIIKVGSERTYPPMATLGVVWQYLRARSYGMVDAVVALTGSSSRWLYEHTSVHRVAVIGNPVSWPLPVAEPIRDCNNVMRFGSHTLLAVGRLVEEKGFDLLIDAFSRIAHMVPDWDLVIVGDGVQRVKLEAYVRHLGLGDRVFLPGSVGNVGDWYSAADVYVLSSRHEGFPNTLAEALASGLPVVSFDCLAGPSDIIRNGVDGLLVPHLDVSALAEALLLLMRDNVLRAQMAERAPESRERFAIERIADQWELMFQNIWLGI